MSKRTQSNVNLAISWIKKNALNKQQASDFWASVENTFDVTFEELMNHPEGEDLYIAVDNAPDNPEDYM